MVPGHISYKAEIKKLKFETDDGIRFPGTALIQFQVDSREKPMVELMGYLGEKEIYKAIDKGEELNLDHCYIDKFSLRDYRLTRNLEARDIVVLKGFSARNSLFGGQTSLDFSYAEIEGEEFSLEDAWISRGNIIFESTRFKTTVTNFHNTRFPEGYFNFKNVILIRQKLTSKIAVSAMGKRISSMPHLGRETYPLLMLIFPEGMSIS